jgi:hypothetical protein
VPPQAVARELRGRHSSANLGGVDHDGGIERLLTRSGGVFVGGLGGGLDLLDQRSDGADLMLSLKATAMRCSSESAVIIASHATRPS